jgi:hypothetical protein
LRLESRSTVWSLPHAESQLRGIDENTHPVLVPRNIIQFSAAWKT